MVLVNINVLVSLLIWTFSQKFTLHFEDIFGNHGEIQHVAWHFVGSKGLKAYF